MNITKIIILKHLFTPTSMHLIKKELAVKKHVYGIIICNV